MSLTAKFRIGRSGIRVNSKPLPYVAPDDKHLTHVHIPSPDPIQFSLAFVENYNASTVRRWYECGFVSAQIWEAYRKKRF
jgi:hypothetical protein